MSATMACETCFRSFVVPDVSGYTASAALGAGLALGVHLKDHRNRCPGKIYDWPDRHPDGLSLEDRLKEFTTGTQGGGQ